MNPANDTELLALGYGALVERLGRLGAERFVVMAGRDPRDYTEWHRAQPDFPGDILELAIQIMTFAASRRAAQPEAPPA